MADDADDIQDGWFNTIIKCNGIEYFEARGIEYSEKLTREMVHGVSAYPLGYTPGKVENEEGKLTILNKGFYKVLQDFGPGWGDVRFDITVQYGAFGSGAATDVIESCRLAGAPGGASEGTTAIERELPFYYLAVKRNGVYITRRRTRRR